MTAQWSVSDVKECQVDVWRPFRDRVGIIEGCFCFAEEGCCGVLSGH